MLFYNIIIKKQKSIEKFQQDNEKVEEKSNNEMKENKKNEAMNNENLKQKELEEKIKYFNLKLFILIL